MITFLKGANFSGKSAWLTDRALQNPWPSTGLLNHSGESMFTGLAMTVGDELSSVDATQSHTRETQELLRLLDVRKFIDRPLHILSGGETVRCAIASALQQGVQELLIDTALEHLDAGWRKAVLELLRLKSTSMPQRISLADNRLSDSELMMDDSTIVFATPTQLASNTLDPDKFSSLRGWGCDTRIDGVSFRYGRRLPYVFDGVSLQMNAGEIYFILGENGSGKTTFLRLLSGTLKASRGTIRYGQERFNPQKRRRFVALSFQNPDFQFFRGTVRDELTTALSSRNGSWQSDAAQTLAFAGIPPTILAESPYACGFAIKKRLANLLAVLSEHPIIAFDEPTLGQDGNYVSAFINLMQRLSASGRTILLISHDLRLVDGLSGANMLTVCRQTVTRQ